jgi:RNA polymerase sigma factor (sigma-70 family)
MKPVIASGDVAFRELAKLSEKTRGKRPTKEIQQACKNKNLLAQIREDVALQRAYIWRFQDGEPGIGELLLKVHGPWINQMAKKYSRYRVSEFEDCSQNAKLSFLEGCARLDPSYENTPLTFINYYIKGYILRNIWNTGAVVRTPHSMFKKKGWKRNVFTFSEMDRHWYDEVELSFEETLVDEEPLAEEVLSDAEIETALPFLIVALMNDRSKLERNIIQKHFFGNILSLQEIGKSYGLSRERIRQIEEGVLEACRQKTCLKQLVSKPSESSPANENDLGFFSWVAAQIQKMTREENSTKKYSK